MAINIEMLKKLLIEPHNFLSKIEKEKTETTLVLACLNWILISIAIGVALENFKYSLAALVLGIIFQLIISFFITVTLKMFGGKGNYKNALDALTYPYFGLAFSTIVVSLISKTIPYVSGIIGLILFMLYFTIGFSGNIKVLKESFKCDLITVIVSKAIIATAFIISIYLAALFAYPSIFRTLFSFF
ncbi:MAG: hypothetical protein QXX30_02655 [Candidatus Aenigmatarchaeota archaeon]